jgi:cell division septation protein DedD
MRFLPVILIAAASAGCATTDGPAAGPAGIEAGVADTQPARLADATSRELAHLARFEPDTLDRVYPQLRALAAALVGVDTVPADEGAGLPLVSVPDSAPAGLPAAPDMADGTSLMHAVHLASYRREAMAARGWDELRGNYPVLADLDARLELAHIPGQGDFLRLKAGPFDSVSAAREACMALQPSGQYCQATDFTGRPLADPAPGG